MSVHVEKVSVKKKTKTRINDIVFLLFVGQLCGRITNEKGKIYVHSLSFLVFLVIREKGK